MRVARAIRAVLGLALVGEVSGDSMCSASLSAVISPCADGACDPAAIAIGDTVSFEVCVENLSFEIPGSATTTPVAAVLQASTEMQVFLACEASECEGGEWEGPTMFEYQGYQPSAEAGSSTFQLGATPACHHNELCGLLTPLRYVANAFFPGLYGPVPAAPPWPVDDGALGTVGLQRPAL